MCCSMKVTPKGGQAIDISGIMLESFNKLTERAALKMTITDQISTFGTTALAAC